MTMRQTYWTFSIKPKQFMVLALILYVVLTVASWMVFQKQPNSKGSAVLSEPSAAVPAVTLKSSSTSSSQIHTNAKGVITLDNGNQLSLRRHPTFPILENLPSVDYYACCGLGHRLSRMASAAYVARHYQFDLRSFWGWCGEDHPVEVHSHLFRPSTELDDTIDQPMTKILRVAAEHNYHNNPYYNKTILPFYNEVPGFRALVRRGGDGSRGSSTAMEQQGVPNDNHENDNPMDHEPSSSCACRADKVQSDVEFYTSLRQRFRDTDHRVETFVQTHFVNATVLGLHVRAGNGEEGDFVRKGRVIANPQIFVQHVSDLLVQLLQRLEDHHHQERGSGTSSRLLERYPPVLYIATDTPSIIDLFRMSLNQSTTKAINFEWDIPVLDLPQERRQEGAGVLFGESDKVHNKGQKNDNNNTAMEDYDDSVSCLLGWRDSMADMILLSHADVVIAGKPSSFSQTLPMSLAFGRPKDQRKVPSTTYCEVIPQSPLPAASTTQNTNSTANNDDEAVSPKLDCFGEYMEWCCNHSTWIQFSHKKKTFSKEFVLHPTNDFFIDATTKGDGNSGGGGSFIPGIRSYPAMRNRTADCLRPRRGRVGGGLKDKCLPHEW